MSKADTFPGLTVRHLWRFDQAAISHHFVRLDAEARRMRFGGVVSDAGVEAYAADLLRFDTAVYGAFLDGRLRAVAEMRGLLAGWPATVEAAFSVEADWQNRGIGTALVSRVIAVAQNRGIKTLFMICLPANVRMRHLAAKHDAVLTVYPGEVEAVLDPPWPTPSSIAEELAGETQAFLRAVVSWSGRNSTG